MLAVALAVACGIVLAMIVLAVWPYTMVIGFGLLALGLFYYRPIAAWLAAYSHMRDQGLDAADFYSVIVAGFAVVILARYMWEGRKNKSAQ